MEFLATFLIIVVCLVGCYIFARLIEWIIWHDGAAWDIGALILTALMAAAIIVFLGE